MWSSRGCPCYRSQRTMAVPVRHKSPQRELGDCDITHQLAWLCRSMSCTPGGVESGVAFVPAVPGLAPWGFYVGRRGCPCYRAGLASEREAGCRSELAWRGAYGCWPRSPPPLFPPPPPPTHARGCIKCYLTGLASEREAGCRSELAWSERRAGCPERTSGGMARATPTHARGCIKCNRAGRRLRPGPRPQGLRGRQAPDDGN
jgi:hypothetical protein